MAGLYRSKGSSVASRVAGAVKTVMGGAAAKEKAKKQEKNVAEGHKRRQELIASRAAEARKTAAHRSALAVASAKEKMAYKSKLAHENAKANANYRAKVSTERIKKAEQIKTSGVQKRVELKNSTKKVENNRPKNDMQVGKKQVVKILRKRLGVNKRWK